MNKVYSKLLFFLAVLLASLSQIGCLEKTVYPAILITISSVIPSDVRPTLVQASGTFSLPSAVLAVRADTPVPAKMTGYSINYFTMYGEPIPALTVPFTPSILSLTTGGSTNVTLYPYTGRVVELFNRSTSAISPITAEMTLTIEDVNNNTIRKAAYCQLHKPE